MTEKAPTRRFTPMILLGSFVTGLAVLAPVLLTVIVLGWVLGQLFSVVGPDSMLGHVVSAGGRIFIGDKADPILSFFVGLGLVVGFITVLGLVVRNRAKKALEDALDGLLGRIPVLGTIYRPVAQLVRGMSGQRAEEMSAMGVCRVEFGAGIETIAFLASNEIVDAGGGPARMVMIPTAPVPIGGALLLVPAERVHIMPDMKFDDIAKLYLTMGMAPPAQFVRSSKKI